MSFEVKGKIKVLYDRQDFPSGFYKRDFVITTNEQYPQDIKFGALKERVDQLNGLVEGDEITVKFDVRGREYNGNYYVDLNAWRIERGVQGQSPSPTEDNVDAQTTSEAVSSAPLPEVEPVELSSSASAEDDLPF
jgi:single-strand DNA-binding protein